MSRRIAVTGAAGQLGRQLVAAFEGAGHEVLKLSRPQLDLEDPRSGIALLAAARPDVLIHAAAWTDVDGCARDPDRAMRLNAEAPAKLAAASAAWDALFVQISTNEVFDGNADLPYGEHDDTHPINPYGASKLAAEQAVAAATPQHLVIRTAWLFGPGGSNFVTKILATARRMTEERRPLRVVEDEWGNPTWTPMLADAIRRAVEIAPLRDVPLLHLAGSPATNRFEWARQTLTLLGPASPSIEPIAATEWARSSRVPLRAVLSTGLAGSLGIGPLDWREATTGYARSITEEAAVT